MMRAAFPVGPRAELSALLVQAIERHYDLGPICGRQDLGGAYNLNIRLDTEHESYVARVYRPWVTGERLDAIQSVQRRLHAAQIPVALPLAARAGGTYVELKDRLVEVEPFIKHDTESQSWSCYEKLFAFLGHLHHAFSVQLARIAVPLPIVENYTPVPMLTRLVQRTRERIRQTDHDQQVVALSICNTALRLLQRLDTWWQQTGRQLPQQVVHGDYGSGNVLMRKGQVVALVDLEFLAVHERVFEVAYALYWMMERAQSEIAHEQRSWHRIREMIAEYDRTNPTPLTEAERRALPFEMVRVPLHWIGEASLLPNPTEAVLERADQVALAHWIADHTGKAV
jgi:Ser/Thr protein kinase RdoA (MazF antagonist)